LDNNIFDFRKSKKLKDFFMASDVQKTIANDGIDHPFIFNEKIGRLEEVPNLYLNPSFIDENKAYERYTKFIFN